MNISMSYMDPMDCTQTHVSNRLGSFGNMLLALEEMETALYAVDLPLKKFSDRYRPGRHSGKGLPKTRRRWLNFLASEFRFCIVTIPRYTIIKMVPQIHKNYLYSWIVNNSRACSENLCTVLLRPDPETLYNELIRRKILCVRGHRVRYSSI